MSSLTATTQELKTSYTQQRDTLIELCHQLMELDPDSKEFEASLEKLGGKIDGYHHAQAFLESELNRLMEQRDHYEAMVKYHRDAIKRLRDRALHALDLLGVASLKSPNGYSINRKPSYSVIVQDSGLLPEIYKKTEVVITPDKTGIKIALMDGEKVPGATLQVSEYANISKPRKGKTNDL